MSGNINTTQDTPQPVSSPALNPLWRRQRRSMIFSTIGLFVALLGIVIIAVDAYIFHDNSLLGGNHSLLILYGIEFGFLILAFLLNIATYRKRAAHWRELDLQRERARAGDPEFLAAEQPIPDANALPLPITIRTGIKPRGYVAMFLILYVLMGVVFFGLLAGFTALTGDPIFSPHRFSSPAHAARSLEIVAFTYTLIMSILFGFLVYLTRQWIKVTEQGITARFMGRTNTLAWEDAKEFAMALGLKKPHHPIIYELSGSHASVRWMRQARPATHWVLWLQNAIEPPEDFDNNERKIEALLSLVEAKTHLPLYDLRDTKIKYGGGDSQ